MEVLSEGKNFKLVQEEELPAILEILRRYLPDSIKVSLSLSLSLVIIDELIPQIRQ